MIMEEFVASHAEVELNRLAIMTEKQLKELWKGSREIFTVIDINKKISGTKKLNKKYNRQITHITSK